MIPSMYNYVTYVKLEIIVVVERLYVYKSAQSTDFSLTKG